MAETVHAPHGPLPRAAPSVPITRWGTPVMHRAQQQVTPYDDALRALAADMVATMYAADGVGLAACQIGEDVAMFVFDCPDESGERTVGVVCNPGHAARGPKTASSTTDDEGCLSFPGAFVECARPDWARSTAPAWTASRSPSRATDCWPGACSTRPTTPSARSSATGSPPSQRKKLTKAHEAAAADYPLEWPASESSRD